jgi:hypothetical protein
MTSMITQRLAQVGRSYSAVVRSPSYFPLWLSQLISSLGDTLHYIALIVLVYNLTGRGAAVAVLVVAEVIPSLLLGPIAGVIIDRFSRKSVLIWCGRHWRSRSRGHKGHSMRILWPLGWRRETRSSIPPSRR